MSAYWAPGCDLQQLRDRAQLLAAIRSFFEQRQVLEVETPLLSQASGTDPNLEFFSTQYLSTSDATTHYLQSSPEFAMKRLLAAGCGSIYQICKAFRNGEQGRWHNPEFTLLEWYRVGIDMYALMREVGELLTTLLPAMETVEQWSYSELFLEQTGLDPLRFEATAYADFACRQGMPEAVSICGHDHGTWLDFLFSHSVQPSLTGKDFCFVYGFPAVLSSLARPNSDNPLLVERFEVFVRGIELGNGYHELTDGGEQQRRFEHEAELRDRRRQPPVAIDRRLLAALNAGLPDCSGIAIGLDRLLAVRAGKQSVEEVLAFSFLNA